MAYQPLESHDEYLKMVEQYEDYEAGTYQSMTLKEKMDFLDGIHTNHIPLFDEDGDDMDTADDYYAIRDEFLEHPEQFAVNHILDFMEMLDDNCYQPSFMETVVTLILNIVRFYQLEGVVYLLSHLHEVPSRGHKYGLHGSVCCLVKDDTLYPLVKEALARIRPEDRGFVLQVLSECGDELERNRRAELEDIMSRLAGGHVF